MQTKLKLLLATLLLLCSSALWSQDRDSTNYPFSTYKPLKLDLTEDGSKYVRFIIWNQIWAEDGNLSEEPSFTMRIRRSRFLAYAQISPRFLVITHFGLNTLTSSNMDPIGNAATNRETINGPQLFIHGAWTEFKITNSQALYLGGGLHYWNGLSRASNASTLNFMTMDNYRQGWAQLGLTDQFARHVGIYAKGELGKFKYTLALNDPMKNALGSADLVDLEDGSITYSGRRTLGPDAGVVVTGYFEYQFLNKESSKLPYRVGTYLGKKKVFNIGAGFFNHNNGVVRIDEGEAIGGNVNHFSVDAFFDSPVGNGAMNAYLVYYNFNYGYDEYNLGTTYGSGNSIYAHYGYLLPFKSRAGRMMPYLAYSNNNFKAFENSGNLFQFGVNWFVSGHNAKVTIEYRNSMANHDGPAPDRVNGLILQTHIFL